MNNNDKTHWAKRITSNRLLKLLLAGVFMLLEILAIAQPLPPSTPQGNPVPVGGILGTLLLITSGLILLKNKVKK